MNAIIEFLNQHEDIIESLHIIFVVAWISGMLFIARIYVYHVDVKMGSTIDKIFSKMEKNTIKIIMNPSINGVFILGIMLAIATGHYMSIWLHIKFVFVILLAALHGLFAYNRKKFLIGENKLSSKQFRILNESVFIIFCIIIFLVVLKPFQ